MGVFSRLVWLDARMAEAVRASYGPSQPGFDEFRFARAASREIQSLGGSAEGLCAAVLVERAVLELLIRAELARSGSPAEPHVTGSECWSLWLERPGASQLHVEFSQEQLMLVATVLACDGPLFLAKQPLPTMRLIHSTLHDLKDKLFVPLQAEATRVKRVNKQRWTRLGLIVVAVAFGVYAIGYRLTHRPNVALHKAVTVSSMDIQVGVDPSGLVDGNRNVMGFHTTFGPNQTATIDLGHVQKISRIIVYNRSDCCQERAVPLRIEVSEDGKSYQKITERKDPFPISFTTDFPKTKARYVKLTALQTTVFHLNEVEVY